jgi:hypothetical protein
MSSCVRSGWCCKQGVCPYGKWDSSKSQCKFLIGDTMGEYSCGIYDRIIKDASSVFSPAFGTGCCSTLNPDREKVLAISKR